MEELKKILFFLSELRENNYREWFNDHKDEYNELKESFKNIVAEAISRVGLFDKQVTGLQAEDAIFRIYRDIRFSNDKTPYKTHFAAYIAKGGRKSKLGGYYLHIEPGSSMIACGIWCPEAENLKLLRQSVFDNIVEFTEIINQSDFKKVYPVIDGDSLKKLPSNFAGLNFEYPELLKLKSYVVSCNLEDEYFYKDSWLDDCIEKFKLANTFNNFLNSSLSV